MVEAARFVGQPFCLHILGFKLVEDISGSMNFTGANIFYTKIFFF